MIASLKKLAIIIAYGVIFLIIVIAGALLSLCFPGNYSPNLDNH